MRLQLNTAPKWQTGHLKQVSVSQWRNPNEERTGQCWYWKRGLLLKLYNSHTQGLLIVKFQEFFLSIAVLHCPLIIGISPLLYHWDFSITITRTVFMQFHYGNTSPYIKGIWYGSKPVVISLQLTNFQSLIGLKMHHIVLENMKSTKRRIEISVY